jgi:hypothetical protein
LARFNRIDLLDRLFDGETWPFLLQNKQGSMFMFQKLKWTDLLWVILYDCPQPEPLAWLVKNQHLFFGGRSKIEQYGNLSFNQQVELMFFKLENMTANHQFLTPPFSLPVNREAMLRTKQHLSEISTSPLGVSSFNKIPDNYIDFVGKFLFTSLKDLQQFVDDPKLRIFPNNLVLDHIVKEFNRIFALENIVEKGEQYNKLIDFCSNDVMDSGSPTTDLLIVLFFYTNRFDMITKIQKLNTKYGTISVNSHLFKYYALKVEHLPLQKCHVDDFFDSDSKIWELFSYNIMLCRICNQNDFELLDHFIHHWKQNSMPHKYKSISACFSKGLFDWTQPIFAQHEFLVLHKGLCSVYNWFLQNIEHD